MSSLCNILQRCARNAFILGGTPLRLHRFCNFNPVYSDPTSISRQSYSSDASETSKNGTDSVQKYIIEMMNAKKSGSNIAADQTASKSFTADSAQKTPIGQIDSVKPAPNIGEDQKASKTRTFNKNLNLRKYYISISVLSSETTPESLREFYSQFGEIASCNIVLKGKPNQFGSLAFSSREAMDRALNSLPHCIDGKEMENVRPAKLTRNELTLKVLNLSPKTTVESLGKFYSRFGWLNDCRLDKETTSIGQTAEVTFGNIKNLHLALDAQPHVIDGSEVFLQYATYDLDLYIRNVPEGVTEEDLIAFYSKYGQLRECRINERKNGKPQAFVSFSAIDEFNRAMDDRPHIIGGRPVQIKVMGKSHSASVSLFVGSLPENVTEETLRKEFSKYGKPVFWELRNDGHTYNQSGPFGRVMFSTEKEALNALNNGPHTIEGVVVDVRKASEVRPSFLQDKSYNKRFR